MEQNPTVTVSRLNEYIKMLFDSQSVLKSISVRGEISNFKYHSSGHLYFTLKDGDSLVRAVMFRSHAQKLRFVPENGMSVVAHGYVSVYTRDGQYQLYADKMDADGVGALYLAYERLKAKLEAEGLFDSIKRDIPQFPSRIGVVTSPTGAALQDIINITGRRYPSAEIVVYPSAVQGSEAPRQLVAGMEYFSKTRSVDVVIIGRGGGSLEDLWAFNNEQLARAVAASSVPVISAVGHETDFTICDFAADRRAPTPSAAAELAVPDAFALHDEFISRGMRCGTLISNRIQVNRENLRLLSGAKVLSDAESLLSDRILRLDRSKELLDNSITASISSSRADLREAAAKLGSLSPLAVLSRGYGAVSDESGNIVRSAGSLDIGQRVGIRFYDGTIQADITEKEVNEVNNG